MMMPVHLIRRIALFVICAGVYLQPAVAISGDLYVFRGEEEKAYFTNIPGPDRVKVRLPLVQNKSGLPARTNSTVREQGEYARAITEASWLFAVDPDLVRAVIKVESNFNVRAVSSKGALGLMQLMPDTAREMNVSDPFDPVANIRGGVRYLSQLMKALEGNIPLALAAYNAGLARVIGHNQMPQIRETRDYVEKVLLHYREAKNI